MPVIRLATREATLRRKVRAHLRSLGFGRDNDGALVPPSLDKAGYRELHVPQRRERLMGEKRFLLDTSDSLIEYFADGVELDLSKIRVRVELIRHTSWQSDLFRFATLLWSIPVSKGFGRRLRFLVWDEHSGKLLGIFALGDPVFNLAARDNLIGWSSADRTSRLVNILDGYVVGAVPPFNRVLGGKFIATLMRTQEVVAAFRDRYHTTEGIISETAKKAQLVAITTTSALGRSSVYNRLKLDNTPYLESIGFTAGYGHFHFPQDIFKEMRAYLSARRDPYADNHKYGDGPNWRLRTIRQSLRLLGLDPGLVRHGLAREVFLSKLADNAFDVLNGERKRAIYSTLLSANDVAERALSRWIMPRAARDATYREVTRESILESIKAGPSLSTAATRMRKHGNRN